MTTPEPGDGSASELVERLAHHRLVGNVPRAQLEWLAARGRIRQLSPGDVLTPSTGPVAGLYIVLSGHLSISVNRGSGPRKITEWTAGDVTGLLPYSRLTKPPGNVVADEPTEVLLVARDDIPTLIQECHDLTAVCVHVMVDRTRIFTSSYLFDEKMASLGRVAAGLAHELNNPASAVSRSAKTLGAALEELDRATRSFCEIRLSDRARETVKRLRDADATSAPAVYSPLERSDREDAISQWLADRGIEGCDPEPLVESSLGLTQLDGLAEAIAPQHDLAAAVRYLSAAYAVRRLASEIETASARIYTLVAAVKGHTYMDQTAAPKLVKVEQGLSDTLTVFMSKAQEKSVDLRLELEAELPSVDGFGGELNHVWSKLVDNALDAVGHGGRVVVSAQREGGDVLVRVIDDGPGIPVEIRGQIFDPFFTTKPVGGGTGLGLDIARRLVQRHKGEIDFTTGPSGTEFRVRLPFAQPVTQ
jgi:signal transduction histidine kinase